MTQQEEQDTRSQEGIRTEMESSRETTASPNLETSLNLGWLVPEFRTGSDLDCNGSYYNTRDR